MAYRMYFSKLLFPVMPESLTITIANQNETVNLINDGEVNVLKKPGLKTIKFTLLLPNHQYRFATYPDGFHPAFYYLSQIEKLKEKKKAFQFIVSRELPNKSSLDTTNITCVLEDYTVKESASSNGFDVQVEVNLKEYVKKKTKKIKISKPSASAPVAVNESSSGTGSSGSSGGGSGETRYKIQVPGYAAKYVYASSVQEAIKKALGANWTGSCYVNDVMQNVTNGQITTTPTWSSAATAADNTASSFWGAFADTIGAIGDALASAGTTGKTISTNPKKVTIDQGKKLVLKS